MHKGFSFTLLDHLVFSRVHATLQPAPSVGPSVGLSVRRSVGPSVRPSHFNFRGFCGLWPHCFCPSEQVTSNMAPAHPQATWVAVFPALFIITLCDQFFKKFWGQIRFSSLFDTSHNITVSRLGIRDLHDKPGNLCSLFLNTWILKKCYLHFFFCTSSY